MDHVRRAGGYLGVRGRLPGRLPRLLGGRPGCHGGRRGGGGRCRVPARDHRLVGGRPRHLPGPGGCGRNLQWRFHGPPAGAGSERPGGGAGRRGGRAARRALRLAALARGLGDAHPRYRRSARPDRGWLLPSPWANGELRGRTLSLRDTAERWRAIDRCPPGPGSTQTTEGSSRQAAVGGVGGTQVVTWTVFGGGHTWPGSTRAFAITGPATQEFDAAEGICRFAEPLLMPPAARLL